MSCPFHDWNNALMIVAYLPCLRARRKLRKTEALIEIASYLRLTLAAKRFLTGHAKSMKKVLLFLCVSFSALFGEPRLTIRTGRNEREAWWTGDYGTGDWYGVRTTLTEKGLEISGGYTAEVWGNTTGGLKRGAVYTGLLDFGATLDLGEAGWLERRQCEHRPGFGSAGGMPPKTSSATFSPSPISRASIPCECWNFGFSRTFFRAKDDAPPGLSVRVGQFTADSEFVISDYGALFTNGTFGWPAFLYTNIPAGGPGYPMGALGVRVAANPWEWLTCKAPFLRATSSIRTLIGMASGGTSTPTKVIFGLMNSRCAGITARRRDFRARQNSVHGSTRRILQIPYYDEDGIPLADEDSSGNPLTHQWNYGFYWILDQMLYREPGKVETAVSGLSKDGKSFASSKTSVQVEEEPSNQGLGWFGRIAFGPQDRNFVGFYVESGLVYTGPIPTRDEDQVGVGFVYAQLTNGARQNLELEGSRGVGAEMVLEVTYQANLTPWMYIKPNAQFVINPGGTQDLGNAFVLGGRVSINF